MITALVVLSLAVWRISHLLMVESGPFRIFVHLRKLMGIEHDADDEPNLWPNTYFGQMFECPYCLTMNLAIVFGLLWIFFPTITLYIALPFAISTMALLVNGLQKQVA